MWRKCPSRHRDAVRMWGGLQAHDMILIVLTLLVGFFMGAYVVSIAAAVLMGFWLPILQRGRPLHFIPRMAHRYGLIRLPGALPSGRRQYRSV